MSLAIAAALVLLAQPPELPANERVIVVGKVREVNSGVPGESRALLDLDDKSQLVLHGASRGHEQELRRLAGARVKLHGKRGESARHFNVERYEILDVGGGVVPRLGRVAVLELDGKRRLLFVAADGQAELLPESWMKKMEKHIGAKIWVSGNRSEGKGELTPARFGILRTYDKDRPDDASVEE